MSLLEVSAETGNLGPVIVLAGDADGSSATQLNKVLTATVRAVLAEDKTGVDPRRWLGPARSAVSDEVERLLVLLASAA